MKELFLIATLLACSVSYGQECTSGDCENGQGTFTWADGEKYVGEWRDDKKHGLKIRCPKRRAGSISVLSSRSTGNASRVQVSLS